MKTPSQPRAIFYIVAIQIWEYFSFTACVPYSSFILPTSLVLMTATRSTLQRLRLFSLRYPYSWRLACRPPASNRVAVITGALLMTLGHVVLGLESDSTLSLYAALAIIICGYGLFKSILAVCWANFTPLMTTAATGDSRCSTPPGILDR